MARPRAVRRPAIVVLCLGSLVATGFLGVSHFAGLGRHGASVEHFEVRSAAVHRTLREAVVVPHGTDGSRRPLLVFLHGRRGDEDSNLHEAMFAALRSLGERAPVIVFPDGGRDRYWHDRRGGAWGRYVLDEVIPQTQQRFHTDPRRVALGGISMGGFGAYDLMIHSRRRFCAVGGHSPALWQTGGETAAGAFDSAEDFARHDVIGTARSNPASFARQPLWLDAGTEDPFDRGDRALAGALRAAGVGIRVSRSAGGHNRGYWDRHWHAYLAWYARALERCRR